MDGCSTNISSLKKIRQGKTMNEKLKIMVVDDNPYSFFALSSMLLPYEIEPDTVTDGDEAFEKVKQLFVNEQ